MRALLQDARLLFVALWSAGRVKFEVLSSGGTYANMTIDAGEISLRAIGTMVAGRALILVVACPPRGGDHEIEVSRKSLARAMRRALVADLDAAGGDCAKYNGITSLQDYGSFGLNAGLNFHMGPYARLNFGAELNTDTRHFVTAASRGDGSKAGEPDIVDPDKLGGAE
ncbi:MAG: hypothetical protein KC457_00950 [Myxococcales bacterium]|nr:hypothetical protein [Myxococcales bacterium]